MNNTIILFEPYCWGIEHASFNAAFLRTIELAYPQRRIIFCGEDEQVNSVQSILIKEGVSSSAVYFHKMKIYRRNAPHWQRWRNEFSLLFSIKSFAANNNGTILILCSVTGFGLFVLNILMKYANFYLPVVAVPHSILADLEKPQSFVPWRISNALKLNYKKGMKFIALSESIYKNVMRLLPGHESKWAVLDHPYFFNANSERKDIINNKPDKIRFGFFGAANTEKGFDLFCKLAERITQKYPECEFNLIGFYFAWNSSMCTCQYVEGISGTPLTPEEFQKRAGNVTYAVWLANPHHYHLTASATFLDSLAYAKPGIYLRNQYIESYFDKMGDIGYLCDSFEEIHNEIEKILNDFPLSRYLTQVQNILDNRKMFAPACLAKKIPNVITI